MSQTVYKKDISNSAWHALTQLCAVRDDIVFFDSSLDVNGYGRYSYVCCDPFLKIRQQYKTVWLAQPDIWQQSSLSLTDLLNNLLRTYCVDDTTLPVPAGCIGGYLTYEYGLLLHDIDLHDSHDYLWPLAELYCYDVIAVYDAYDQRAFLISTGFPECDAQKRQDRAVRRAHAIEQYAAQSASTRYESIMPCVCPLTSGMSSADYYHTIEKIKAYIARGDTYQVNFSEQFSGTLSDTDSGYALYEALKKKHPVPFGAYLHFASREILSFSMELLMKSFQRAIMTRPIKGTQPRGNTPQEDAQQRQKLLVSEKDIAELIMIIDMERNDLGKICEIGSIGTQPLYEVEPYATVFHLVSTVSGILMPHISPADALMALFPGGSITGAPKKRTMEIISELEPVSRGVYCGALGYFGFNQVSQFSIPIRTIIKQQQHIAVHSGGGITYSSDPSDEYEEVRHKIRFLL